MNLVSGVFEGKMFTYFFPALRYAAIADSTGMEISYKGEKDCDITILHERFFPSGKNDSWFIATISQCHNLSHK